MSEKPLYSISKLEGEFDESFQDMIHADTQEEVGNCPDENSFVTIHLVGMVTDDVVREFSYV